MPKFKDIFENWELGIWSFLIIAAAFILFWGLLYIFNQHHRVKPPKSRIVIAGCGFIGIVFLWFFLSGFARICAELNDIHNTSSRHSNYGLEAGVISASPVKSVPTTNTDLTEESGQSMPSSLENKTIESGVDLALILHIANAGDPTTIWNCQTWAVLPGGKEIDAKIPSVLIQTNQMISTIVGPIEISKSNFLLNDLTTKRLDTGAAGNYWVEIHINGINEIPAGTHIMISFMDVYNRLTTVDYMWEPGE